MILEMPEDGAAVHSTVGMTILFIGLLLKIWSVVGAGGAVTALALIAWLWPREALREAGASS